MILRSFYIKLVLRIIALALVMMVSLYALIAADWYIAASVSAVVAVIMVIELIYYLNRTNRELANFLLSLRHEDYTTTMPASGIDHSFKKLREAFREISRKFQDVRIQKELHYQYLQTLIEHVEIALISFNDEGKIELYNSAAARLLKYRKPAHIDKLKSVSLPLYNCIRSAPSGRKEMVKTEIDGQMLTLAVLTTRFILKDRAYSLASIQDIKAELEEQELDSWQKLIRVLTHEIMNSVTPISSLSESISEVLYDHDGNKIQVADIDQEDLEDIYSGIRTIVERSHGLIDFVRHYKSLTRLPAPSFNNHKLIDIIESVHNLKKPELEKRQIDFIIHLHDRDHVIFADRSMIEQILLNLLINAMDALKDKKVNKEIRIRSYTEDGSLTLIFKDNGKGISRENRDKIFVPFYTTKKSGTGIGLSLARQIMRLHRGSINVKSAPGEGTEFILKF